MKKTIFLVSFVFLYLIYNNLSAQKNEKNHDLKCFWFNISINTVLDQDFNRYVIHIENIDDNIQSGSLDEFAESLKKNLLKNLLCIGPFSEKKLVKNSQKLYEFAKSSQEKSIDPENEDSDYYCYFAKPFNNSDDTSIQLVRIPARTGRCTRSEFVDQLFEGLTMKMIAIGPFENRLTAEKSKYFYRKYGEQEAEGPENTEIKSEEMMTMAKKWDSLKIDVLERQFNENKDSVSIVLNIEFPPYYFEENMVQVIGFRNSINNNEKDCSDAITVQGVSFSDNNPVISYNEGGHVSYRTKIPADKNKKTQIIVKSTILSNREILECKEIAVDVEPQ